MMRVWRLTSVCLSIAYIGPKSRTERPRKTKIGTEVAHVTRDSDTTFNVIRSKVKVTRPLWLVVLAGQHGHTVMVTYPYAYMTYIVSPLAGLGGGISWRPPGYSLLFLVLIVWMCCQCVARAGGRASTDSVWPADISCVTASTTAQTDPTSRMLTRDVQVSLSLWH